MIHSLFEVRPIMRPMIFALGLMLGAATAAGAAAQPNILLVLADDLGYSDLRCYGGEIDTPQLDALAAGGLRFTQFHNTARCWPTRASLLTGYYAQHIRRDELPGVQRGNRPPWAVLLPARLRAAGYRSYHSGKWHIDGAPIANGFDRSYQLEDTGRYFSPRVHFLDGAKLSPVRRDSGYYATTAIVDHALEFLADHAKGHSGQPFFQFLAFTAPHFPLHALPEDIDRYRRRYLAGWEEIRDQRWRRQQQMGLIRGRLSDVESGIGPPYDFPEALAILGLREVNRPVPWTSLSDGQREFQATKMAIHAAMVDRMDREIGRVIDQLKATGALDNTLILFLSDNGASAEIMVRDDGHDPAASPGSAATHLCLGPGWSTVANTPFRRHKTWVHQGGIATPFIMHWPDGIKAHGELRHAPGHVIDIVPTILELAGVRRAAENPDAPRLPGESLVPLMARDAPHAERVLWWAHEGNRAIRIGSWKLVAERDSAWELYDLANDPTETRNLADSHPQRVVQLAAKWQAMADEFVRSQTLDSPK